MTSKMEGVRCVLLDIGMCARVLCTSIRFFRALCMTMVWAAEQDRKSVLAEKKSSTCFFVALGPPAGLILLICSSVWLKKKKPPQFYLFGDVTHHSRRRGFSIKSPEAYVCFLSCRGYDLPDLVRERNTGRSLFSPKISNLLPSQPLPSVYIRKKKPAFPKKQQKTVPLPFTSPDKYTTIHKNPKRTNAKRKTRELKQHFTRSSPTPSPPSPPSSPPNGTTRPSSPTATPSQPNTPPRPPPLKRTSAT